TRSSGSVALLLSGVQAPVWLRPLVRSRVVSFNQFLESKQQQQSLSFGEWPKRISIVWLRTAEQAVTGFIEVGELLNEAKADLGHGNFITMIKNELPFSRFTAFKLMAIAKNPALANVSHGQHLPPSWTTLYELSKLSADLVAAKIADGTITPKLER